MWHACIGFEIIVCCLYVDSLEEVQQYTSDIVNSIKSWSYSSMYRALDQTRSHKEKDDILQKYFQDLCFKVLSNPEQYALDYIYHCVTAIKA